jgi:exocyst complex component 8
LDGLALEGLHQVFNFYVKLLINAMPGSAVTENLESTGHKIVKIAETETQQIALLANAILLADELLPRAVIKLSHSTKGDDSHKRVSDKQRPPEQRELKKRLQREVDRLRDSFCRQHALELIFTEDGIPLLNAQMYLDMEEKGEIPEWFPSPIFQVNKQRMLHASFGYSSTLLLCYVLTAWLYITCIPISIVIVV